MPYGVKRLLQSGWTAVEVFAKADDTKTPNRRRQCTVSTCTARSARGKSSTAADMVQPLDNRLLRSTRPTRHFFNERQLDDFCSPAVAESRWIATFYPCELAPPTDFRLVFFTRRKTVSSPEILLLSCTCAIIRHLRLAWWAVNSFAPSHGGLSWYDTWYRMADSSQSRGGGWGGSTLHLLASCLLFS